MLRLQLQVGVPLEMDRMEGLKCLNKRRAPRAAR